ncbi:MAG: fructosamine kinase family protein [Salibacteraceae bacterium]
MEAFFKGLEKQLSAQLELELTIANVFPVSGGDINQAFRVATNGSTYFIKRNSATRFPGMFEAEAKGLELLRGAECIAVPKVLGTGEVEQEAWLALEWIERGGKLPDKGREFGTQLAQLHQTTQAQFGLDHPNYIGSLPQNNRAHADWVEFFVRERLEPQLQMAFDAGLAGRSLAAAFERLFSKLDHLFPVEAPALQHGDLWGGNYLSDANGKAWLIDPAVYFGHREMDLGMTLLFGGFDQGFYEGYQAASSLEKDWRERTPLTQLYPLMVHLNLFGPSYLGQVEAVLRRFA